MYFSCPRRFSSAPPSVHVLLSPFSPVSVIFPLDFPINRSIFRSHPNGASPVQTQISKVQTQTMTALRKQFAAGRLEQTKREVEVQASRTARLMAGKRIGVTL